MPIIFFPLAIKEFLKNRLVLVNLVSGLLINLIVWLLFYFKIPHTSEPIALHYNIYFGIDLIGQWSQVFWLPLISLIILFINFLLAALMYFREKIIAYFLIIITTIIQGFLLIAAVCLIFINKYY